MQQGTGIALDLGRTPFVTACVVYKQERDRTPRSGQAVLMWL